MPLHSFARTEEGHIIEEDFTEEFTRILEKKRRMNPLGEDVYLFPGGKIKRDEDCIIAVQRIWRERIYAPPGALFAKRGKMYQKCLKNWNSLNNFKDYE
jgi:hypothetical protein